MTPPVTLQQSQKNLGNFATDPCASEDLHLFYPCSGIATAHVTLHRNNHRPCGFSAVQVLPRKNYLGKIT